MEKNRGITIVALVVIIAVLLIIGGVVLSIKTDGFKEGETEDNINIIKKQKECTHDWVVTSEYDFLWQAYRTITKCSKCGKTVK